MNSRTKQLVEAANALIGDLINKRPHFDSFQNLCKILVTFEQSTEQPEAISGEKTALEIWKEWCEKDISWTDAASGAMSEYASQQTAFKDQKITELTNLLSDTNKRIQEIQDEEESKDKEIKELKEAISELIQVKDWKDKYGKDEHYLKAMPISWENVRKLIQK